MNGKRKIAVLLVSAAALMLSGCGSVKNASALIGEASRQHGDCTVVSQSEAEDRTKVVLRDSLQGFEYEVTSYMSELLIDGSSFGSYPSSGDTFVSELKKAVAENAKVALEAACGDDVRYEVFADRNSELLLRMYTANEERGREAALGCAKALQEQNRNNRLDGMMIYVDTEPDGGIEGSRHLGSVKLPDVTWLTSEDEDIMYFTEIARQHTDKDAVFLRKRDGKFSETGADIEKVVCTLGSDYPTSAESPVTFYYFRASDGSEYFICDFNYYVDKHSSFQWYSDYKGRME